MAMTYLTKLKPEPMGAHNLSTAYGVNSLVMSGDGAAAYISVKDVPAGTPLTNTEYWKIHTDLTAVKQSADAAAQRANAARNEMLEIARNLTDMVEKSGNLVQAELVGGLPFDRVETVLAPIQSGSGVPYPAGGGKNKLNASEAMANGDFEHQGVSGIWRDDGDIILNGTLTGEAWIGIGFTMMAAGNTYTVSVGGNVRVAIWDRTANALVDDVYPDIPITFVAANTGAYAYAFASATGTTFSNERVMLMVNEGSEALPWEPSINVRTISGWTGAKLTRCGKNLLPDIRIPSGGFTSDGNGVFKYVSNNNTTISTFTFKAGVTYTISATAVSGAGYKPCIIVRNPTGDRDGQKTNYGATGNPLTFSFDTDTNFDIILQAETGNGLTTVNDSWAIQLEVGTATAYEPYQGNTYTADFGQTVYGGTLDWNTGVLTVDRAIKDLSGTESVVINNSQYFKAPRFEIEMVVPGIISTQAENLNMICSHYKVAANPVNANDVNHSICGWMGGGKVYLRDDAYSTVDEYKSYLAAQNTAGTPVQVCYKLATPTTIQLTPQEIKQLQGVNTLYGDGSISIIGRANPVIALSARIAALESAATNI